MSDDIHAPAAAAPCPEAPTTAAPPRKPRPLEIEELLVINAEGAHYARCPTIRLQRGDGRVATSRPAGSGSACPPETVVLDGVLSSEECDNIRESFEAAGEFKPPGSATVRRNDVVVWIAPPSVLRLLWRRLAPLHQWLEQSEYTPPGLRPAGLSARLRLYRYSPGQTFLPHYDGSQQGWLLPDQGSKLYEDEQLRSRYTILFYLNSAEEFDGGSTTLFAGGDEHGEALPVHPVRGGGLVFPHGDHPCSVFHSGALVTRGVKYAIRGDILFCERDYMGDGTAMKYFTAYV